LQRNRKPERFAAGSFISSLGRVFRGPQWPGCFTSFRWGFLFRRRGRKRSSRPSPGPHPQAGLGTLFFAIAAPRSIFQRIPDPKNPPCAPWSRLVYGPVGERAPCRSGLGPSVFGEGQAGENAGRANFSSRRAAINSRFEEGRGIPRSIASGYDGRAKSFGEVG